MTGVRVTIDDAELTAALAALAAVGRDPSPALKPAGVLMVRNTRNRIIAEQAPDGAGWPALKPRTLARKRGPGMLRERAMRGGLFGSLTSQVDGARLLVGTNKIYAATHQFGAPGRGIPARPFLGVSAEDREEITGIFRDFAARALGRR